MLAKLKNFLIESRQELKQVQWPTRREAAYLTAIVICLSLILAFLLGGLDYLFAYLLRIFVLNV